jgi:hypothetical protein
MTFGDSGAPVSVSAPRAGEVCIRIAGHRGAGGVCIRIAGHRRPGRSTSRIRAAEPGGFGLRSTLSPSPAG